MCHASCCIFNSSSTVTKSESFCYVYMLCVRLSTRRSSHSHAPFVATLLHVKQCYSCMNEFIQERNLSSKLAPLVLFLHTYMIEIQFCFVFTFVIPAYPGSPGQNLDSHKTVAVVVVV